MMFLSRVAVDTNNRQKIQNLSHLGAYHDWVEQSFPTTVAAGERPRHLWRLDTVHGQEYLLVLSSEEPDLVALSRYGVAHSAETKSYDALLAALANGQQWQFRLTANPTHSVASAPGTRGHVYPHVTVQQQLGWLMAQTERHGFKIGQLPNQPDRLAVDIVSRDYPTLRHAHARTTRLSRVTYEGLLEITDVETFREMLTHGIGREKAYGMGLMTIIPRS